MPAGLSMKETRYLCISLAKHLNLTPEQVMEAMEKHVKEEITDIARGENYKERVKKVLDTSDATVL